MIRNIINKYKNMPIPLRASLWFIICSFLQRGVSLITTPIFTRVLSTEEYGQYTLYDSWMGIISIFVTFKLSEAVFNKSMVSEEKSERRSVLASYQLLTVVLWLVAVILYLSFHVSINNITEMNSVYMGLMFLEILFSSIIALWTAFQRFEYNYRLLIIVTLILAVLNPLFGLLFIKYVTNSAIGRILGIVVAQFLISLWLFIYNIKKLKIDLLRERWAYALSFNLPLIPHYLSQIILSQADRIMVGKYVGKSEAALYGIAYTIGMLGTMVTQSISSAYVPWMYRELKKKNHTEVISNNILLLIFIDICISCIFVIAPEAMYIIGGEKYIQATNVIYPVAVSVSFMFTYGLFANIEYYYEKRIYVMIGTCLSAVLNLVLNYIFINKYGYIAAAYTTLFCYFCYGAFHVYIVPQIIKKKDNVHVTIPYSIIALASVILIGLSAVMQMLITYPVVRYLILLFILLSIYLNRSKMIFYYKKLKQ